jgi:hypothetical protein
MNKVFIHKQAQNKYAHIDIIAIVHKVSNFEYVWFQPSLQLDKLQWEFNKQ